MNAATTGSIDLTVEIPSPREMVWRAITDPSEITRWFAPIANAEPGAGGFIEISWGEGMTGRNTIEVWEPPTRLVAGNAEMGLREEYTLSEIPGGTSLRLRQSGFSDDAQGQAYLQSVDKGWRAFLAMLKHGVGRHAGQPFRNVTLFSQIRGPRDAAWESIVRPGGVTRDGVPRLASGDSYDVELFSGERLRGTVLHALWPGFLVLAAENLDDSILALLCEGGDEGAMLTITWILNGNAASREPEIRSAWESWAAHRAS